MPSIKDYIKTDDPNFLNEYKRPIYDTVSKKFFNIQNGALTEIAPIQGSNYDTFSVAGGLQPSGKESYQTSEAFRYWKAPASAENNWNGLGSAGDPRIIANGGQPIKSGFSSLPIAGDSFIGMPTTTERPADPTFNIATTGRSAAVAPKQFYRVGVDIYDASTGTKIGATDWKNNWAPSGAQEVKTATLTSPTGEKKVVGVGTPLASNLLNNNWTLGNKVGGGTITPSSFTGEPKINTPTGGTTGGTSSADQAVAGLQASVDSYLKTLEAGAATEKKQRDDMLSSLISSLKTDVSKESMQLAENANQGISDIEKAKAQANTELQLKLAEIDGLDKSYQNATLANEGKTITLARIQGANNQALREYTIKKNLLTSEASLIQAKYLGLSGQLEAAQKAADRAVDLRYQDQMYTTNNQIKMLELLQGNLDEQNEEYRFAVTQALQDQRTALSQQADYEKMVYGAKLDLMSKYPDAGITMNDTDAQARAKLVGSKIYQEQIRPPVGAVKQTDEEKQIEAFQKDARDLVPKLLNQDISWGAAFDTLRTNYPNASVDTINAALGGGIPYDPETGKWGTAWGTAAKAKK